MGVCQHDVSKSSAVPAWAANFTWFCAQPPVRTRSEEGGTASPLLAHRHLLLRQLGVEGERRLETLAEDLPRVERQQVRARHDGKRAAVLGHVEDVDEHFDEAVARDGPAVRLRVVPVPVLRGAESVRLLSLCQTDQSFS